MQPCSCCCYCYCCCYCCCCCCQISEYYPWSGAERENRRRDMRRGEASATKPGPATLLCWVLFFFLLSFPVFLCCI
jgi:hypothetical protein